MLAEYSFGTERRVPKEVDVERLGGPPSKSVIFDIESGSNSGESSGRNFLGMSAVGLSIPNTSQHGGTDYGTSELMAIARKKGDETVGASVAVGSLERLSLYSKNETQPGLGQSTSQTTRPDIADRLFFRQSAYSHSSASTNY